MPIQPIGIAIKDQMFKFEGYMTASSASGSSTLTVKSISNFAINQVLLIGEMGDENSEIIKTHTSTTPTGTTITLASNLVKTHGPYTKVRVMLYDQVEISHADTITGTKTVLDTISIQPESEDTRYDDSSESAGYFFTRFKNSIDSSFSAYSDYIPYAGYNADTVSFVINYALKRNKLDAFTKYIDYEFCIDEINSCLKFITGKLKGWSKLLVLDSTLDQTEMGINKMDLPSDIWENLGNKSIQEVRMGSDIVLGYKIWSDFEKQRAGSIVTQVTTEAAAGDLTLEIDDSYDYPDSGSVNVYISEELYNITYTGITRSTTAGILTGIPATGTTGAITVTIPVDTNVWKGEAIGKPRIYSIDSDSNLVFWPLASALYDDLDVNIDYYTGPTKVDSDADTLDAFRYDLCKYWLTSRIRWALKNDGKPDLTDGDHIQAMIILNDYIRTDVPANRRKRGPKINSIRY